MAFDYRRKLEEIRQLLDSGGEEAYVADIDKAVGGDDKSLDAFLVSNVLWGGSGSIPDNCLLDNPPLRKRLMQALIELGNAQIADNQVNPRTHMWASTFQKWIDDGIV